MVETLYDCVVIKLMGMNLYITAWIWNWHGWNFILPHTYEILPHTYEIGVEAGETLLDRRPFYYDTFPGNFMLII